MKSMTRTLGLPALASTPAWAHDAPGLGSSHWHATDTVGFLLAAVAVLAAWMWWRSGR